jgi:DNA-binding CsgD family transcriptional regulator
MMVSPILLETIPLVGRSSELSVIRESLDRAEQGRGSVLLLTGEGGIGKTRLARAAFEEAARREWGRAIGAANPVETGVPYALFADALAAIGWLDADERIALTRGVGQELAVLFPGLFGLSPGLMPHVGAGGEGSEFKSRMLWNFTEFLRRYTQRRPLLIVLEDLHWADAATLELLHFLARHLTDARLLWIGTFKSVEREANVALRMTTQSLVSLALCRVVEVEPLSSEGTQELVQRIFDAHSNAARTFAAQLHVWTAGNPFFIQETLKSLIESGLLVREGDRWLGWEVDRFDVAPTIRDAILQRVEPLSKGARALGDLAAILGIRPRLTAMRAAADVAEPDLMKQIEELLARQVLAERKSADVLAYDFTHPMIRETIYGQLGETRKRYLHGHVAQALERYYGTRADEHADELAFHFSRAHGGTLDRKATAYLTQAGRLAFAKYANREAASYLAAALERLEADEPANGGDIARLLSDLARTRLRLGDYDGALSLWERVRAMAEEERDERQIAAIERRMGIACFWKGRHAAALGHYDAGLKAAERARDREMQSRISVAKGMCLHELGRPSDAKVCVEHALALTAGADPDLVARVHRALMLLHVWTGPQDLARRYGEQALRMAAASSDRTLLFSAHWGLGVLEGLSGNSEVLAMHIEHMRRIADEVNSPVLRAWTAELEIEYAAANGEWDEGVLIGERAIALARALNQSPLLPRLLVWTALLYLPRGELERGRRYVEEAWALSGAGAMDDRPFNVHVAIPAHIGRAALHLALGEYDDAVRVGEAGLEVADRHGYIVWSIHRLVPVIAESLLWLNDLERARNLGERLRRDSESQGHRLGLAWASACEAVVAWLGGDPQRGAVLLGTAAERLEAIPFVFDAARVRRQLAGRLADLGDREGALRELRRAHDVFVRLGAEHELGKTRGQFRELGVRPPARAGSPGAAGLSGRELEIARMVMARKSNKAISRALGISPRTVSTHLSNIFRKLEITTRGELADYVRTHDLSH